MNKSPIRIQKVIPPEYKLIEWKLHNVCNHNCSYCGEENKDGSNRWKSLEIYKEYTNNLHHAANGSPLWIQITGGEPTLFPELLELMQYIKSKGIYVSLISNGSRTLRWWKEAKEAKVLDMLFITYHPEQTNDYQHIIEVLNLFHNEPTETLCIITHSKGLLDKALTDAEHIINNTGAMVSVGHMVIKDYDIYATYTPEQFDKLKQASMVEGNLRQSKKETDVPENHRFFHLFLNITFNDNTVEQMRAQMFMKNYKTEFENWKCANSEYIMKIENDLVYRGICSVGKITNVMDPSLKFNNDYIICNKKSCDCRLDLTSTRYLENATN
jgi:organic radical activating enzyme